MKRFFTILAFLAALAFSCPAQIVQQAIVNTPKPASGGTASWGNMDFWMPVSASAPCSQSPGATITGAIAANCTLGGTFTSNNFGETALAGSDTGNALFIFATPFIAGADANGYKPLSITFGVAGTTATSNIDMGIYSNSASAPATLLCHIGTTSISNPSVNNTTTESLLSHSCPTLTSGTTYWVGYVTSSNTLTQSFESGNCPGTSLVTTASNSAIGSSLLPSSFPANTAITGRCYTFYITANGNTPSTTWTTAAGSGGSTVIEVGASQGSLGGTLTLGGTVFPASTATQSIAYNNATSFATLQTTNGFVTQTSANISTVVVNGYYTPGPPNAGGLGGEFDQITVYDNSGDFAVMQLNSGQCGGTSYGVAIETGPGTTLRSTCVVLTPGHRYSFSLLFDCTGGTSKLALFDPSNSFTQVGSTVTVTQATGGFFAKLWIGNNEGGTASGTTTFFEDVMLDWTNATFPNWPH